MTKTRTLKPKTCTKDKSNLTLQAFKLPTEVDMPLNYLFIIEKNPYNKRTAQYFCFII